MRSADPGVVSRAARLLLGRARTVTGQSAARQPVPAVTAGEVTVA